MNSLDSILRPVVRDPRAWFACARELSGLLPELSTRLAAAFRRSTEDPSRADPDLMPLARAYFLLAGYTAENYIKGAWIGVDPKHVIGSAGDSSFLPATLDRHSACSLAAEAGILLSGSQQKTLRFLEDGVRWFARYPFPKQASAYSLFGVGATDVASVEDLLKTLRAAAFSGRFG
jgi:hypothetical protein